MSDEVISVCWFVGSEAHQCRFSGTGVPHYQQGEIKNSRPNIRDESLNKQSSRGATLVPAVRQALSGQLLVMKEGFGANE